MITTKAVLTQAEWANYFHLPGNTDYNERILPSILEAQQFDLRPLLTKDFYKEIAAVIENDNLIVGGESFTQAQYDLFKPYLIDIVVNYAFARYLASSNAHVTRYGVRTKTNPYSTPVDAKERDSLIRTYRSKGGEYGQLACEYLDENLTVFTTWRDKAESPTSKGSGVSISTPRDNKNANQNLDDYYLNYPGGTY